VTATINLIVPSSSLQNRDSSGRFNCDILPTGFIVLPQARENETLLSDIKVLTSVPLLL